MIDRAFATTLKYLRKQKGFSQESFSFEVELHRTYISQLERGMKSPSLKTLYKISQALDIKLGDLMTMVDEEFKNVHFDK